MIEIDIKESTPEYTSFIYATWLHSYKHGSYFAKRITNTIFFKWHHKVIEKILDRDSVKILVASPKEEPNIVLGYLVYETMEDKQVIHYIYVKKSFRRFGIATKLLKESGVELKDCSFDHWCFDTDWICAKLPTLIYNPYLL